MKVSNVMVLKTVLIAGFAMFAMFFGSGNLVFPLLLGSQTLNTMNSAFAGFVSTAVMVPMLGLIALILFNGDRRSFFNLLGPHVAFVLTLIMLALVGPFGVVPRCLTVAYGGLSLILESLNFVFFSLVFCVGVGALVWKENNVIDIIGLVLSPFKFGFIALILIMGLFFAPNIDTGALTSKEALLLGTKMGYQTMDLVAAFFFSATTVSYLKTKLKNPKETLMSASIGASALGGGLLMAAYFGFVTLGASYASKLSDVKPEQMLVAVSQEALGSLTAPLVALTIAIACLATAVVLVNLFVDFIQNDIFKGKLQRSHAIVATCSASFIMSLVGFATICGFLGSILEIAYPALIVFTVLAIISKLTKLNIAAYGFWITLLVTIVSCFI